MSNHRASQTKGASVSIEDAALLWHEFYNDLEDIKGSPHAGASFLSFYRDRMVASANRLLELGLDVSDLRNPRVVPVPIAHHPKTKAEARRWEAEMSFRIKQLTLSFAVTGVGAHVVYSAVGDEPLVEVLASYVRNPSALERDNIAALISASNLEVLALACSLWLLEPTGALKTSAADLEVACFNRMLYAFELHPIMRLHRQARDNHLPEAVRSESIYAAAGWARANLSLRGKPGEVLRRALGEDAPLTKQYERFLQELPSASLIAWDDREPAEPLRSTGHRDKNLARRVAEIVEKSGNEVATRPGKLARDTPGMEGEERAGSVVEGLGEPDPILEEATLRLTALQELAELERWVEKARLSEGERRVYELDMQHDYDTASIARELGKAESTVRVQRKSYTAKIRKAAGL